MTDRSGLPDLTLLRLRRAGVAAERRLEDGLAGLGVSLDELRILAVSAASPGVSAVEIAAVVELPAPAVSRLVQGLAQRGLLIRRRSRLDRRTVMLRCSPAALTLIEACLPALEASEAEFLEPLSGGQRRALQGGLERLRRAQS
ncbi:MAG: helix-turn-helix domain-containing protein [Chloroflexota bacterium]|nr:helix-turn-helix domain-containing protein [Chloroflexota bacterium]